MSDPAPLPELSVVVPAHGRPELLDRCLAALQASDYPRFHVTVVDDASDPPVKDIVEKYGYEMLRIDGLPRGPSHARNRGVEYAAGPHVVFVDADVAVHPNTLRRFAELFADRPDLDAAFGSYDDAPTDPGWVSQFKNLLHHYHHQRNPGACASFWTGCGAIRADAFFTVGGFDEGFRTIQDVELGLRLHEAGYRVELHPEILCTHEKRWTLASGIRTDLFDRGVPWVRLLLENPAWPRSLNASLGQRVSAFLVGAMVALLPLSLWSGWWGLASAAAGAAGAVLNAPFYALLARKRGLGCALCGVALHWLHYLCCLATVPIGTYQHLRDPGRRQGRYHV